MLLLGAHVLKLPSVKAIQLILHLMPTTKAAIAPSRPTYVWISIVISLLLPPITILLTRYRLRVPPWLAKLRITSHM